MAKGKYYTPEFKEQAVKMVVCLHCTYDLLHASQGQCFRLDVNPDRSRSARPCRGQIGTTLTGFSDRRDGQWNNPRQPSAGSSGPLGRRHESGRLGSLRSVRGPSVMTTFLRPAALIAELDQALRIHLSL